MGKTASPHFEQLVDRFGPFPTAVSSKTPTGGYHIFYQHRDDIRNTVGKLGPGLDIRGEGGYVFVPPSQTEQGAYVWCSGGDAS